MRRNCLLLLLGLFSLGLLSGCGSTATVSGEVTVDGHPLEKGIISFAPLDGRGAPATASIENGRYEVRTVPGSKRVQISAPVVVGKRPEYNAPNAPMMEITAESIPPRYNSSSDLTLDVHSGGNTKDWAVESKGHKP